ncbi:MAG: GDSL-type esterase/lipase family protein [Clostridia bacterium]|nr:GDSL-type esterase/lipase family protein [Clostridia bacterium]
MKPFEQNERVLFVGDSITCHGGFMSYIQEYYLTHCPEKRVLCFNAGVSGGTAVSANRYLEADLALFRPTAAVLMLGMNDMGRGASYFEGDGNITEEKIRHNQIFFKEMAVLAERLAQKGLSLIFCTPTPFDDGMETETPAGKKIADTLFAYGCYVRGLAEKYAAPVVDFFTPMVVLNEKMQRQDKTLSLIGKADRVHPTDLGHAVMARLFLREQGFTDVEEPTVQTVMNGTAALTVSAKNALRKETEVITRNLRNTVYFAMGEDWNEPLAHRYAAMDKYMEDEKAGVPHNPYITNLVAHYRDHAEEEETLKRHLVDLTERLYD